MFTGLIEAVGEVVSVRDAGSGRRLRVRTGLAPELRAGDSVAVNGVCLTVVDSTGPHVEADLGPETVRVTTLGGLREGQAVSLERPMRADGRFGGHLVQGHVDATGVLERVRPDGDTHWLTVSFGGAIEPYVIPKGSIAIDGISLTVAALQDTRLDVMIVPFTWAHTHLPRLRAGDRVNLECDMVARYVARVVEQALVGRKLT